MEIVWPISRNSKFVNLFLRMCLSMSVDTGWTAQAQASVNVIDIPFDRIFIMVPIKLIILIIDDVPAKCKEKIAMSTDGPLIEIVRSVYCQFVTDSTTSPAYGLDVIQFL